MTWSNAQEKRVLCGTRFDSVLALGGSASYLSPSQLRQLTARGKRGAVVMHYADGERPITDDLDAELVGASLSAATQLASRQITVGRFGLSHLPAA